MVRAARTVEQMLATYPADMQALALAAGKALQKWSWDGRTIVSLHPKQPTMGVNVFVSHMK